ncbi:MAG: hypothetical protein EAZ18_00160 [Oscillatoriales cyanobacterium]|nr:MAG: hypothetical protein EAZ18_00160 [Oscillatoriales cyanobacterium]
MASEFLEYANSKFFVSVGSDRIEQDEWGNVQPSSEVVEVQTFLKESRGTNNQPVISKPGEEQGVNFTKTYLKGYLVNPMKWPNNIRPRECEVEYYGRRGKLQVLSQFPRPFDTELLTGDIVEGWAIFQA